MLNLHIWTTNNKLYKRTSLDILQEEIKKEALYRNKKYKDWWEKKCFNQDPNYFRTIKNCINFEDEIKRNNRELKQGLESLSLSLSTVPRLSFSYPEEIIKHPKDVLSFIKKSITKKNVTDNILTFDPIIFTLIEAKYINDKRVCIFINGIKKDSSLITVNKALEACVKPFYQLNVNII